MKMITFGELLNMVSGDVEIYDFDGEYLGYEYKGASEHPMFEKCPVLDMKYRGGVCIALIMSTYEMRGV